MKTFKHLLFFFMGFVCALSLISQFRPVQAAEEAYLITTGLETPIPERKSGYVYFYKNVSIPYKNGKVVISSTPDGKGEIRIGDVLQVLKIVNTENIIFEGYGMKCQNTSDIIPPADITSLLSATVNAGTPSEGFNLLTVRLSHWCSRAKSISPLYLVVLPDEPIVTPTPAPAGFFRLPWDYEAKGMNFTEAALAMSAHFDHEYPLLSSILDEPAEAASTIVPYTTGLRSAALSYSGHDGYDYARQAAALYGDSVLAAAQGVARVVRSCAACGNMIIIDHPNGYQTRYQHLQDNELISTDPTERINVEQGQKIGRIGATGNVIPSGLRGAHLHFSVYQDVDNDGVIDIPEGATDPYGWNPLTPDPWAEFTFTLNGKELRGNTSRYLWQERLLEAEKAMDVSGGEITLGTRSVTVLPDTLEGSSYFVLQPAPVSRFAQYLSIGTALIVQARSAAGDHITTFIRPLTIKFQFSAQDMNRYEPSSVSIFSSQDGEDWQKEATSINWETKEAIAEISHLSYFALMGKLKDVDPPETEIKITGAEGEQNFYRSSVGISITSNDIGEAGVAYVMYSLDGNEWHEYTDTLIVTDEGLHTVAAFSEDTYGNVAEQVVKTFTIDTTPVEAIISFQNEPSFGMGLVKPDEESESVSVLFFQGDKSTPSYYELIDRAGNSTKLILGKQSRPEKYVLELRGISYNDQQYVPIDIRYRTVVSKKGELKQQFVRLENKNSVRLLYNAKKDLTEIILHDSQKKNTRMTKAGQLILQLLTKQGRVNYSY